MTAELEPRRVLLAVGPAQHGLLQAPFARGLLPGWETADAATVERARFLLQNDVCDVLLVDESFAAAEDRDGLAWYAARHHVPALLLAGSVPERIAAALEAGYCQWLPRRAALDCPPLLAAGLAQALRWGSLQRQVRRLGATLTDTRRQASRLVDRLWETAPVEGRAPWYSQRHMLDRLEEEICRTGRHGTPFSVVLGEVEPASSEAARAVTLEQLTRWTVERVAQAKRRCDVAGQYGPHGFMLLLPGTAEPGAVSTCERLQQAFEQPPGPLPVVASFGIAACAEAATTPTRVLSRAEERLEQGKANRTTRTVGHAADEGAGLAGPHVGLGQDAERKELA
jgi:diguanylate cyclase (GGDEF)-like protein